MTHQIEVRVPAEQWDDWVRWGTHEGYWSPTADSLSADFDEHGAITITDVFLSEEEWAKFQHWRVDAANVAVEPRGGERDQRSDLSSRVGVHASARTPLFERPTSEVIVRDGDHVRWAGRASLLSCFLKLQRHGFFDVIIDAARGGRPL